MVHKLWMAPISCHTILPHNVLHIDDVTAHWETNLLSIVGLYSKNL